MDTSFHSVDLTTLGQQLQSFLDECPLRVQCAIRDERLIVLGQHPEGIDLDAAHVLKLLERKIQSLQINFTQQVRLYLRMGGQRQPYAHRWFMIQPPPPPPPRRSAPPPAPAQPHRVEAPSPTSLANESRLPSVGVMTRPLADTGQERDRALAAQLPQAQPEDQPQARLLEGSPLGESLLEEPPRTHNRRETQAARPTDGEVDEPELAWLNTSTHVLDLDTPVWDAQVLRAIGLDDQELDQEFAAPLTDAAPHAEASSASRHQEDETGDRPNQAQPCIELEIPDRSWVSQLEPAPHTPVRQRKSVPASVSEAEAEAVAETPPLAFQPASETTASPEADGERAEAQDALPADVIWKVRDDELDDLVSQLTAFHPGVTGSPVGTEADAAPLVPDEADPPENPSFQAGSSVPNTTVPNETVWDETVPNETVPNETVWDEDETEFNAEFHSEAYAALFASSLPDDWKTPAVVTDLEGDIEADVEADDAGIHGAATDEARHLAWNPDAAAIADETGSGSVVLEAEVASPSDAAEFSTEYPPNQAVSGDAVSDYAAEYPYFGQDEAAYEAAIYEFIDNADADADADAESLREPSGALTPFWQNSIAPLRSLPQQAADCVSRSPLAQIDGRMAIAASVTVMGVAGAFYTLTRPCVVGGCPQITTARDLSEKSAEMMRQAEAWKDIERAGTHLYQAVDTLEPIPMWSSYASESRGLLVTYSAELEMVQSVLDVENVANAASRTSQDPLYSLSDWEAVRSLWQQAISQLEAIPSDSDLYAFARQQLRTYRRRKAEVDQQISLEENAREALEKAKQAAQLAQARQGSAQSLENWQFARVTWIVALDRLQLVPEGTIAFWEAESLTESYQTSLDAVTRRVEREQAARQRLTQAEQQADLAQVAEQRLDWQQAMSDWQSAITYIQEIEDGTSPHPQAEDLLETYSQALANAEEKQLASDRIQMELQKTCIGEIRICDLLSVGEVIKVRLDDGYVRAIDAARSSGNNSIQAVVTDHQLILRRALELIANEYDLPVEVYNPENALLERHLPNE